MLVKIWVPDGPHSESGEWRIFDGEHEVWARRFESNHKRVLYRGEWCYPAEIAAEELSRISLATPT